MSNCGHKNPWWDEEAGFFGEFYVRGDNSHDGHLAARKLSLVERTSAEVDGVCRLLHLGERKRVLDVPCGYGRHSIELARRGHSVVGVDLNPVLLDRACREIRPGAPAPVFERQNMLTLGYREEFDAVINMFFSFGFFETDEENLLALRNFLLALKPEGKFLMHTDVNISRIRNGKYRSHEVRDLVGGGQLRINERYVETTRRLEGTWTISDVEGDRSRSYSVRVFDAPEFIQMCIDVGFSGCQAYGSWDGTQYSGNAEEIIFVATKR